MQTRDLNYISDISELKVNGKTPIIAKFRGEDYYLKFEDVYYGKWYFEIVKCDVAEDINRPFIRTFSDFIEWAADQASYLDDQEDNEEDSFDTVSAMEMFLGPGNSKDEANWEKGATMKIGDSIIIEVED